MRKLTSSIYQGDISDLNVLGKQRQDIPITLFVNVGSTNYVPPDRFAIHLPMRDEADGVNDWEKVVSLALLAAEEVARGGLVFVNCDAGISRSVTFVGMLISILDGVPMDDALMVRLRYAPGIEPLEALWKEAGQALSRAGLGSAPGS